MAARAQIEAAALSGGFADPPRDGARAFRAILDAMARPGSVAQLGGVAPPAPLSPAAGAVLLVLADPEVPLHLAGAHDCPAVADWLTFQTGAPLRPAEAAGFAIGTWPALLPLDRFPLGTPAFPDRAATLVVEVAALAPVTHRLTGPGIDGTARIALPGEEALRLNAGRFPCGLDLILTCGDRLVCLPRSSRVEAL